ncbi:MAG: hypothetical protein RIQ56_824 [Candidatus Parcubacteria bacterium]
MSKKTGLTSFDKVELSLFRDQVMNHWNEHGRHALPWRKTLRPYKILVSEVMLQQTQVSRVLPKYRAFLRIFPTSKALSRSSLASVLKVWSGLGYNRRAKFLREAAILIEKTYGGIFPREYALLRKLPGVGDYTAKAVRVFSYNLPDVLIETNIRTVYIHHFFQNRKSRIRDEEILSIARLAADGQDPRIWHWALMDYGAHLKEQGIVMHRKSAQYAKQATFKGSVREVRGAILRSLAMSATNRETLEFLLEFPKERFSVALQGLYEDGLIQERNGIIGLALK